MSSAFQEAILHPSFNLMSVNIYDPISIIIPVFNEAENIQFVIIELLEFLDKNYFQYEIVVINDGSEDNTKNILESMGNKNNTLHIINFEYNKGQSKAIYEGIKCSSFEKILILDGDGQYNPENILDLHKLLCNEIRMVSGIRSNRKDPFFYKHISKIGNLLISRFFGMNKFDLGCGLKMAYKCDLLSIPYFKYMHRYLHLIYFQSGISIGQVDIDHRPRLNGKSKYTIFKSINIIPRLIWIKVVNIKVANKH